VLTTRESHIQDLIDVAEGKRKHPDPIINESWRRCILTYKLDPSSAREIDVLPSRGVRERQDAMDELLSTARYGFETLYRQIAGLGYVLVLTNGEGVAVDYIGDPTFQNHFQKAGVLLGANWQEKQAGTSAVGTCIATEQALTVHLSDHFDTHHGGLTCTSAPIFDPRGNLAAVLDISALRSQEPKVSQLLALQLVESVAHKIETAHLFRHFHNAWIVKLSVSPEFATVDPGIAIALDAKGAIVGFNQQGKKLLASELKMDWRRNANLVGRHFGEFFDCDVSRIPCFADQPMRNHSPIVLSRSQKVLFAETIPPIKPRWSPPDKSPELPDVFRQVSNGDAACLAVLTKAARLVNTQMSILIHGETGTGKEHFAKAVHKASHRSDRPFIAVNCAALPESLIESELFGYEAGAFTGARVKGKKGMMLEAQGGTLFLDEIGDMPLLSQTRLLRVLAERELLPVGATRPVHLDIRVVAATHRNLLDEVKAGRFREDLYFRLNCAVLTLPPVRNRTDLPWLVERLLENQGQQAVTGYRVSPSVLDMFKTYPWPGNVRELVNVIAYACAVCADGYIDVKDLPDQFCNTPDSSGKPVEQTERGEEERTDEGSTARLVGRLKAHRWNVSATARELSVDRSTVQRHMRRLGIAAPRRL
jgi:transcriptional regulator of acetoin/glycerol metabolism